MTTIDQVIEPLGSDASKTIGVVLSIANLETIEAICSTGDLCHLHTAINALREQACLQQKTGLQARMQEAFEEYSAEHGPPA